MKYQIIKVVENKVKIGSSTSSSLEDLSVTIDRNLKKFINKNILYCDKRTDDSNFEVSNSKTDCDIENNNEKTKTDMKKEPEKIIKLKNFVMIQISSIDFVQLS